MQNNIEKSFEKLRENLNLTYKNLAQSQIYSINFDADLINNYFYWNQNIVDFDDNLQTSSTMKLKSFKPKIHLSNSNSQLLLKKIRPSVDLSLCYKLLHNPIIHNNLRQQINSQNNFKIDAIKIFDDFEKSRLVCKINKIYKGVAKNILNKIDDDIESANVANIDLIVIGNFFKNKLSLKTHQFIDIFKSNIAPKIYQRIVNLCNHIDDQQKYSMLVKSIIDELLIDENNSNQNSENNNFAPDDNSNKTPQEQQNFGAENVENDQLNIEQQESGETEDHQSEFTPSTIEKSISELTFAGNSKVIDHNEDNTNIEFINSYKIYSNQFDEIIYPKNFINRSELELLRNQLDMKIAKLNAISRKMTLKLKRKLLSKKNNYFDIDATGGILNRKKYANLIMSPMIEDIWVNIRNHEYNDTALTILLDNSGSMRGNPIVMSALACQIIAEILEKFAIKTEIIGFTTSDWRGGRSRKLWEISGRSKNPGRLNDVRHIVYKSFNQSFKKAKTNLGLMLKEGILKENIDGEALLFARGRLMQQSEKRKILMVISDGTPVDDSTTSANDFDILTQHLKHVINVIEKQGKIEIIGVGIGHATDDYYQNSITIKTLDELGDVMIDKIINVL